MDIAVLVTNVALVSAVVSSGFGLRAMHRLPISSTRLANIMRGGAALGIGGCFAAVAALLDSSMTLNEVVTMPGVGLLLMAGWLQARQLMATPEPQVICRDEVIEHVSDDVRSPPRLAWGNGDVMSSLMAAGIAPVRHAESLPRRSDDTPQ